MKPPDAGGDVLEDAVVDGQTLRASQSLCPGEDGDVGVLEGQVFELVRVLDVEEHVVALAVDDDRTVARGLDDDGLLVGANSPGQVSICV